MILPAEKLETTEVLDWRGLHLLHFQGSSCSQKVRLMLGELELKWDSHPVNLIRHENHTSWFLGINPRGVVPVLVHDGVVHLESNDIISYLDSCFAAPGKSYHFTEGTPEAKEAQQLLDLEDSLHADLRLLTIRFGPLSIKSEKQIEAQEENGKFDEKRDNEVRWWRDKLQNGISNEDTRHAVHAFRDAFDQLDGRLRSNPWLMRDKISIVDLCWYVNLQRLVRLGYPLSSHENLADLSDRLSSRPAFRAESSQTGSPMGSAVFRLTRVAKALGGRRLTQFL